MSRRGTRTADRTAPTPSNVVTTYELSAQASGWVGQSPGSIDGETNPTLEFAVGRTYEVVYVNGDGLTHDFQILDGSGTVLVDGGTVSGSGATNSVRFTASEDMTTYRCHFHPTSMVGTTDTGPVPYKVLGAIDDGAGVGVRGENAASTGSPIGVRGRVPNATSGYGLATPDDARVGGTHAVGGGVIHTQRGDPTTDELDDGAVMVYNSDGSGTGSAGDLVYAINDGGTVETAVVVAASDAT